MLLNYNLHHQYNYVTPSGLRHMVVVWVIIMPALRAYDFNFTEEHNPEGVT